ncbi:MAG TPA: protein translocase subunit SecD [Alphaproteobacteria bacterium]|nr:protein translocase subunit SecD [Alphaproteobacteria bacterium]
MLRSSPLRTAIILLVALAGVVLMIPNFFSRETVATWPGFLPKQQMVLGLDLQGGSHLLLQVGREGLIRERLRELRRDARNVLASENGIGNIITTEDNAIVVELTDPSQADAAMKALQTLQTNISGTMLSVGPGTPELEFSTRPDGRIVVALTEGGVNERLSSIVSQSVEVIRKRIDELGTTEPTIQRQGNDRILVQVPGFGDSSRLKDIISRTARLTFHLVHPTMTAAQAKAQGIPPGYMILPSADGRGDELVAEEVSLGGESLVDAQPSFDQQTQQPVVTFKFDTRGAITFGEITSKNVNRRFAIVLDNQVITAPNIQQPITGGSGQIYGSFTPQSANDLAVLLRAGALPASLEVVEERSVTASLGADSIQGGVLAGIISAVSTLAFMVVAYGMFGIFANIALILNISMAVGLLSLLGATLTLPGIAGIVLTMGMAVDANVLIYERIREERAAGKSVVAAIEAGFSGAMSAIVDSNVTTLIAAVVLFFLGSGPVQGFAVTLALGIVTTLFSATVFTKLIFSFWYSRRRPKDIRVQLVKFIPDKTNIPFMSWRHIAVGISIVLSVASIGWFAINGMNLGIDFKGGSAIEVRSLQGPADPAFVREHVGALDLGDVQVQGFGEATDLLIRIELQPGGDQAQAAAVQRVQDALGAENYEVRRVESVGPTVSAELALAGTIGLSVALVGVLIYLWFRFEWQFAVGAVLSTFHDVILTVGLFAFTGIEFNQSSIAAILTIVGYSLNDTIVVYDRVREYSRKYKKMPVTDLLNLAVNSTLSRTVLTGPTVFMALAALVLFGGEVIRSFTVSMLFGVLVGTYSSIFVAAAILQYLGLRTRGERVEAPAEGKRAGGATV